MQLSDTTNQTGLVQRVEHYTGLPYGSSGDLLRTIINNINSAYDRVMPLLLSYSDNIRWDDPNNTDAPIGYVDISSGVFDYKLTEDDNGLDILNVTNVRILPSATATKYDPLERLTTDDPLVPNAMSPNSDEVGIPNYFVESAGKIFLHPNPNYSATDGIEVFFGREQNYFTVTGTSGNDTTEPGIPKPFHELLAMYAALEWLMVKKPNQGNAISLLRDRVERSEKELKDFIDLRNPTKVFMTMKQRNFR